MYCTACGHALAPGASVCAACGRSVVAPIPSVPNFGFQLQNYANRVKALSIVWFVYGGLTLALGVVGLIFTNSFFHGGFGPWDHGFGPAPWFGPLLLRFGWAMLIVRSGLSLLAGWGLMDHTRWGRAVAIVAALFSLLRIPVGTALGIWTLVTLLGYRNSTLYEEL